MYSTVCLDIPLNCANVLKNNQQNKYKKERSKTLNNIPHTAFNLIVVSVPSMHQNRYQFCALKCLNAAINLQKIILQYFKRRKQKIKKVSDKT